MIYGESVTRLRAATATDRYGVSAPDWSSPAELVIANVQVQPVSSVEPEQTGRAAVVTGLRVISKPGTDLDLLRSDRVRWSGVVWQVVGEVARHVKPSTGALHHAEVTLKRVEG